MTDLERVREQLERQLYALGNYDTPTKVALFDLDAHLKEDAERKELVRDMDTELDDLRAALKDSKAELARLRVRVKELEVYASAMRGSDI